VLLYFVIAGLDPGVHVDARIKSTSVRFNNFPLTPTLSPKEWGRGRKIGINRFLYESPLHPLAGGEGQGEGGGTSIFSDHVSDHGNMAIIVQEHRIVAHCVILNRTAVGQVRA
jgi:hypothetical protein